MNKFKIYTQRLLLNIITDNDAEALFTYRSHDEVAKFQTWQPQSVDQAREFIAKYSSFVDLQIGKWNQIAIRLKEGERIIGDSGLHMINKNEAELGYTISPEFQGYGFATEAAGSLCAFLLNETEVHTIYANTLTKNSASCAVLRKLRFKRIPGFEDDEESHYQLRKSGNQF